MRSWSGTQQGAAAGVVAMVLLVVGNFIYGQPPKFIAASETVTAFYHHHHKAVLIGMLLTGLAVPFYVWFIAHLAAAVGDPVGRVVGLGGILVAAIAAGGDALEAALSQATKQSGDPSTIRTLYQLDTLVYGRLLWAAAAVAVAVAVAAARGALPSWAGYVAWVQGALMILGGLSIRGIGFFSPTGGMALIAYLSYFIGTAAFAVALWQTAPATADVRDTATSTA
jgi:hypothetical protein